MLWKPAGLAVPGTDVVSSGSLLTFQPWEEQGENEQDDIEKPRPARGLARCVRCAVARFLIMFLAPCNP